MEKARNAAVEPQDFAEEDLKKKQEAENARKDLNHTEEYEYVRTQQMEQHQA